MGRDGVEANSKRMARSLDPLRMLERACPTTSASRRTAEAAGRRETPGRAGNRQDTHHQKRDSKMHQIIACLLACASASMWRMLGFRVIMERRGNHLEGHRGFNLQRERPGHRGFNLKRERLFNLQRERLFGRSVGRGHTCCVLRVEELELGATCSLC